MDWACLSVQEINLWDIDVTRTESLCVCGVCVFVYPVCIRNEETLRHPWASRRIVVDQVGVGSLKKKQKNKEMISLLKLV